VAGEDLWERVKSALKYSVLARIFALGSGPAYLRSALVLKLSYLLELADALLAGDAKRAAAAARLYDEARFDLYMDTFIVYTPHVGVERIVGRSFEELGRLALEAERAGARRLAEYLKLQAKLAFISGEALRVLFEIAERDYHASSTGADAPFTAWALWDEWMYSEEGTEWKNRVSRELMLAAVAEAYGKAPLGRTRELMRGYARELAPRVRAVRSPLPPRALDPILKADAEAAKLLEKAEELRYPERVEEIEREAREIAASARRLASGG
jgi:hypothetical protein